MREQLIQYVQLLFAGAKDCDDIHQEILQNTLDRYDDLIAQGKVPEAAYRLAIAGIGDINEILGTPVASAGSARPVRSPAAALPEENDTPVKKLMRAIAVGLYIICPLPLFILSEAGMDTLGLCGLLGIVAIATVLIILGAKKEDSEEEDEEEEDSPRSQLQKSISGVIWAVGLAVYLILSFASRAWHITWVIFPILGALDSLVTAMIRNREELQNDLMSPNQHKMRRSIGKLIWAVGVAVYFLFSFATGAWYISWVIFPMIGAVQGLTNAIIDLKEAMKHEA